MKRIAIVGAGIVGTAAAHALLKSGHQVDLFENGGEVPYPHTPQFEAKVLYSDPSPGILPTLPIDIKNLAQSGDYKLPLNDERIMCVGGQATQWFGITPRFRKESFRPASLHQFGRDWPISYEELEPYYASAERYLGISGSNDDNPFASDRSTPFPLPPFELSWQDVRLAKKLKAAGLTVHTTPQARVRNDFDGRPACQNFGVCESCPVGARYSPNHHIEMMRSSSLFKLHANCLVRRIVIEKGHARGIVYHRDHGAIEIEHAADVVIVAAGALESARLLLLSKASSVHRDGLGNASGQVGRNLGFHHVWWGKLGFADPIMPGRAGPPTMLSHQFTEAANGHGGMTVELFDGYFEGYLQQIAQRRYQSGEDVVAAMRQLLNMRPIAFNAETRPSEKKTAALGDLRDRFGDPFLEVRYEIDDFDYATYAAAQSLSLRFAQALDAEAVEMSDIKSFWSAHHHLGTCRMGESIADSVVDSFGAVHEARGVYISGGSTFVTVTAFQPTLTMVAMMMRTAARIEEELRQP